MSVYVYVYYMLCTYGSTSTRDHIIIAHNIIFLFNKSTHIEIVYSGNDLKACLCERWWTRKFIAVKMQISSIDTIFKNIFYGYCDEQKKKKAYKEPCSYILHLQSTRYTYI